MPVAEKRPGPMCDICLELPASYRCWEPPCNGDVFCIWCDANEHRSGPMQKHEREPLAALCDHCGVKEAELICPGCDNRRTCRDCDERIHGVHQPLAIIAAPCQFCGLREATVECLDCPAYLCEACDELKHRSEKRRNHRRRPVMFVENTPEASNIPLPPPRDPPKGVAAIGPPPTEAAKTIAKLQGQHVGPEGKPAQVYTPLEYMKRWKDVDFIAPAQAHEKFSHYSEEVPESQFQVIAPATIRPPGVYPGAVVQSDDPDEVPAAYTVYMAPVIKKAYIPGRDPEPGTEQDAASDTQMQPMAPGMPPMTQPPMDQPMNAPPVSARGGAAVLPVGGAMQQYPAQHPMPSYPSIGVQYPMQNAGPAPSQVQYPPAHVQQYPSAPMPSPYAPMPAAYPGMMPAPALRGYSPMLVA